MLRALTAAPQGRPRAVCILVLLVTHAGGSAMAAEQPPSQGPDGPHRHFTIQVVDQQTGRGVPLVALRTVNSIRYVTDSNGIVAFDEPGLMDRDVFFYVESHGYEFPKDGFGMRGRRLSTAPGTTAVLKIDRLNIAERLYRVTGQGIYRDSVLTGRSVPLENPILNGQVVGQDSVFTCLYRGRLFWMWGDTARPSYPLGNFAMSGAVSDLPARGGLDPSVGVNLEYFVDETGFSRPMSPLKEPGLVWLDGLLAVRDHEGAERMVARFTRLKDLGEVLERGLVVYNDTTQCFEPLVRGGLDFLPFNNTGHAFHVHGDGREYYYFTAPSPMAVRMRVRARWGDVIDANRYEVLTALEAGGSTGVPVPSVDIGKSEMIYHWVRFGSLTGDDPEAKGSVIKALEEEAKGVHVCDVKTGREILPHNGTVYHNPYRRRWVGLFVQQFGESSNLGEVWYAEADTPVGPWGYACKIVTHNKYSFYNPKHHPCFDQDGGRTIFFEGTYSHTFSGSAENATPRYDYNQIMYRLSLDDPRLVLPVPVYQITGRNVEKRYMLGDGAERTGQWGSIASVSFYAIEPNRAGADLIAIYTQEIPIGDGHTTRLTTECPTSSAKPLFYALPTTAASDNARIVSLYECRQADSGQRLYSTEQRLERKGWRREEKPLCCVWRTPAGPLLLDAKAKPTERH